MEKERERKGPPFWAKGIIQPFPPSPPNAKAAAAARRKKRRKEEEKWSRPRSCVALFFFFRVVGPTNIGFGASNFPPEAAICQSPRRYPSRLTAQIAWEEEKVARLKCVKILIQRELQINPRPGAECH